MDESVKQRLEIERMFRDFVLATQPIPLADKVRTWNALCERYGKGGMWFMVEADFRSNEVASG